jgi:hypothetical protein
MLSVCSSETSLNNCQTTRYHNPDDHYVNHHPRGNLRSHMLPYSICILSLHSTSYRYEIASSGICVLYSMALFQLRFFSFIPYCDLVTLVRRFRKASLWLIHHITSSYRLGYLTQFPCTSDGMSRMWQPGRVLHYGTVCYIMVQCAHWPGTGTYPEQDTIQSMPSFPTNFRTTLGEWARVWKSTISFSTSVCPSVCLVRMGKKSAPVAWIFAKFCTGNFY